MRYVDAICVLVKVPQPRALLRAKSPTDRQDLNGRLNGAEEAVLV